MDIANLETFAAFIRDFENKKLLHEMTSKEIVERFIETNAIEVINKDDILFNAKKLRDIGDDLTGYALAAEFATGCFFMENKIYK